MATSIYVQDPQQQVHRGAIYSYRPVPWLEPPPLWLVRDVQFGASPSYARVYDCDALHDAFRRRIADNQEDVLARAKRRFVVVLSPDVETERRAVHDLVVAPAYTLHEGNNPVRIQAIRDRTSPHTFYLPSDPSYPDVGECYLDFRQIQSVHRKWLEQKDCKLTICLAPWAVKAILARLKRYLFVR